MNDQSNKHLHPTIYSRPDRARCRFKRFIISQIIFQLAFAVYADDAVAQEWGVVEGEVSDAEDSAPLAGITVLVANSRYGTATSSDGRYRLELPTGRYVLQFSSVAYQAHFDSVYIRAGRTVYLDVSLRQRIVELDGLSIEDETLDAEAGVHRIVPEDARAMPSPLADGQRVMKSLPGVASNNELSSSYSIRGGGFNENSVVINGFEVGAPLRLRRGEQEGLGTVNLSMADRMTLYTGSIPVRHGGKLSSVLEVAYGTSGDSTRGSAHLSMLDAGATVQFGSVDGRVEAVVGFRNAHQGLLLATQDLQGAYRPNYNDVQAFVRFRLSPTHAIGLLGLLARNRFTLAPSGRQTFYHLGSIRSADYTFQGEEEDGYNLGMLGVALDSRVGANLHSSISLSISGSNEWERLTLKSIGAASSVEFDSSDYQWRKVIRNVSAHAAMADNRIAVRTYRIRGDARYLSERQLFEAGFEAQHFAFKDRVSEWTAQRRLEDHPLVGTEHAAQSQVFTEYFDGGYIDDAVDSIDERHGAARLGTSLLGMHVLHSIDAHPDRDRLLITSGIRADYYDLNGRWTVSPRLSARYSATRYVSLTGAVGVYHQAPQYRELRGNPALADSIFGSINRNLRSQRSVQISAGANYLHPPTQRYFRAEVFYKRLSNLISYDVDRVRLSYSGENDSEGFAYGLELQWFGDFLPGLESRISYSYLVSRERFLRKFVSPETDGLIPRPMDQRHTLSMFIQDYLPGHKEWRVNMRYMVGSGFPYTPRITSSDDEDSYMLVPGERNSWRFPAYFRADVGLTRTISLAGGWTLNLSFYALNVFDMVNTVGYEWINAGEEQVIGVPTRLTPRTLNLAVALEF